MSKKQSKEVEPVEPTEPVESTEPMVKVRLLTSVVRSNDGRLRSYADGDVYECSAAEAERMINKRRAVAIDDTPPAIETKDAE